MKTIRKKVIVTIIGGVILLGFIFYNPIFNYFINQVSNPQGPVGYVLTKIWNLTFSRMTDWGLQAITIQDDDYILDIGCGGGETIFKLAKATRSGKVYGIDISAEAVKSSLEKNKDWVTNGRVEVMESDVASLPFEDSTFHIVTAIQTHFFWDEIETGFSEIFRVLKVDGTLLVICEKDKIDYHMQKYKTNDDMKELLLSIGFQNVNVNINGNWIEFVCVK